MFFSVAAYQQLTTQKQNTNHDQSSLQDYSDLSGSFFFLITVVSEAENNEDNIVQPASRGAS